MVLPADGRAARPSRGATASRSPTGEPVWSPDGSRFAALVADPSVTDPELEPVKPRHVRRRSRSWTSMSSWSADGSSTNVTSGFDDQVSDPVWSPDGARAVLPRRQQHDLRRNRSIATASRSEKLEPVVRGPGIVRPVGRHAGRRASSSVEDATRPADLWMFGASGQRTPDHRAEPAARPLHVQQAGAVLLPQRRRRAARRAALQAGRPRRQRQGAGHHLGLREADAGHPPLRRARPDVHQPRLRDADAERESESRARPPTRSRSASCRR